MEKVFDAMAAYRTAQHSLSRSGTYVRAGIIGLVDLGEYLVKGDKTAVAHLDRGSQQLALPILHQDHPEASVNAEEKGGKKTTDTASHIDFDPLDGTGTTLIGSLDATLSQIYRNKRDHVIEAAFGFDPVRGYLFAGILGEGAFLNKFHYNPSALEVVNGQVDLNAFAGVAPEDLGTWEHEGYGVPIYAGGQQLKGGIVTIDVEHGWARPISDDELRPILSMAGRNALAYGVQQLGANPGTLNSNVRGWFSLAWGRPLHAGHCTTAKGGPFDAPGLIIEEAAREHGGGFRAYTIETDGEERELVRQDNGHNLDTADYLIGGKTRETLDALEAASVLAVRVPDVDPFEDFR